MPTLKSDATNLVLSNLKKIFWPEAGTTKGDLLDYSRDIAPILSYLKDRPQSLHRHEVPTKLVRLHQHCPNSGGGIVTFMVDKDPSA
jgi:DNA primase